MRGRPPGGRRCVGRDRRARRRSLRTAKRRSRGARAQRRRTGRLHSPRPLGRAHHSGKGATSKARSGAERRAPGTASSRRTRARPTPPCRGWRPQLVREARGRSSPSAVSGSGSSGGLDRAGDLPQAGERPRGVPVGRHAGHRLLSDVAPLRVGDRLALDADLRGQRRAGQLAPPRRRAVPDAEEFDRLLRHRPDAGRLQRGPGRFGRPHHRRARDAQHRAAEPKPVAVEDAPPATAAGSAAAEAAASRRSAPTTRPPAASAARSAPAAAAASSQPWPTTATPGSATACAEQRDRRRNLERASATSAARPGGDRSSVSPSHPNTAMTARNCPLGVRRRATRPWPGPRELRSWLSTRWSTSRWPGPLTRTRPASGSASAPAPPSSAASSDARRSAAPIPLGETPPPRSAFPAAANDDAPGGRAPHLNDARAAVVRAPSEVRSCPCGARAPRALLLAFRGERQSARRSRPTSERRTCGGRPRAIRSPVLSVWGARVARASSCLPKLDDGAECWPRPYPDPIAGGRKGRPYTEGSWHRCVAAVLVPTVAATYTCVSGRVIRETLMAMTMPRWSHRDGHSPGGRAARASP